MANEITLTFKISANAAGTLATNTSYTKTQSMPAADQYVHHSVLLVPDTANSTSPTPITVGGINTLEANGYFVLMRNMDAAVPILIRMKTDSVSTTVWNSVPVASMLAGEGFGPVRLTTGGANSQYLLGLYPLTAANVQVEVLVCTGGTPA